jgi:hypothetical protein
LNSEGKTKYDLLPIPKKNQKPQDHEHLWPCKVPKLDNLVTRYRVSFGTSTLINFALLTCNLQIKIDLEIGVDHAAINTT